MRLTQPGPILDYYIWTGTPEATLRAYTELTGKPLLPPKWAFEPWSGRTGRGWKNTPLHNPVAEAESVMTRFQAMDIPHSAIYMEGDGADSPALNSFMAKHGLHVLSWYFPVITRGKQASLMPEIPVDKLPLLWAGSRSYSDSLGYVDFSNPNALELARRWWKHRLDIGVAGSMVDFGDRVPEEAVFYDGKHGDEMHDFYAYDYQKTYSEVFREKRGDDYILFARAAAPGTQKFICQFGGDHPANFAGLRSLLTGALNLSACGFSTWGSDLGGFLGWPEPGTYMRWTQFACFSPLMRCHGRTPREPWNFGAAAITNYRQYAWVRENLLDYIYDSARQSHETGIPMMRSMAVAFPDELSLAAVEDQYMFGQDLLVAPMVSDGNWRTIHFPRGAWTSLWGGAAINGPASVDTFVPSDVIPVYLRAGAVVPVELNPSLRFGESMTHGRVNAMIATPPSGQGKFQVTFKNSPEAKFLLVYGATNRVVIPLASDSAAIRTMDVTAP
jgi:alpha-glucosidase (family GH31 glycosyl hydrolase)